LAKQLKALQGKRVLDVGCGKGLLLEVLPNSNEKYGIDLDKQALKIAVAMNPSAKISRASMYALHPFKKNFFDVVILANVIELAATDFDSKPNRKAHQDKLLSEIARVLKPHGTLFLTTPNERRFHGRKLDFDELKSALNKRFDFEIMGWNPFPSYPYFLPSRLLKHVPGYFASLEFLCEKNCL